jgi:hypothetical protein
MKLRSYGRGQQTVKRIDLQDTVFETFLKIVGRLNFSVGISP